jgi:hypothetical protein
MPDMDDIFSQFVIFRRLGGGGGFEAEAEVNALKEATYELK